MIDARHYPGSQFLFGALGHPTTFIWGWLEPEPKAYRWSVTDSYVQQAIEHHLPVMLTMGKTPEWAAADRGTVQTPCRPHLVRRASGQLDDWRDFVAAVATHYKGKVERTQSHKSHNQGRRFNH